MKKFTLLTSTLALFISAHAQQANQTSNFTNVPIGITSGNHPVGEKTTAPAPPLAINLVSFDVTQTSGKVIIAWTTNSEINNSHFIAERSKDGINFDPIATINAAGNSEGLNTYNLTDNEPIAGTSFYHLKVVDRSGNITYSSVRKLIFSDKSTPVTLLEQPVNNAIHLNIAATSVTVINMAGNVVKQFSGSSDATYDVSGMIPGQYLVRVQSAEGYTTLRMLKK